MVPTSNPGPQERTHSATSLPSWKRRALRARARKREAVSGLWSIVCGLWSIVCCLLSAVCGLWSAVRCQVSKERSGQENGSFTGKKLLLLLAEKVCEPLESISGRQAILGEKLPTTVYKERPCKCIIQICVTFKLIL